MEACQVVLEEVMRTALDAARSAAVQASNGDRHAAGQVYAYHNVLDVLREQAAIIGLHFDDAELARFAPDELIAASAPRRVA